MFLYDPPLDSFPVVGQRAQEALQAMAALPPAPCADYDLVNAIMTRVEGVKHPVKGFASCVLGQV